MKEGDEVDLDNDTWGIILGISEPFLSGNYTERDGTPILGREYTIFVPEED